jgi:hypothetical protein
MIWMNHTLYYDVDIGKMIVNAVKRHHVKHIVIFLIQKHNDNSGHANVVIYSAASNEVERFDPYGSGQNNDLDIKLRVYFAELIPSAKYIDPTSYLPQVGFQMIDVAENENTYIGDPEGFCVAWSIWYADNRLQFPSVERRKLIKYAIRHVGENKLRFRSLIRNYAKYITDIRDDILSQCNLDINQYINYEYDTAKLDNNLLAIVNESISA